MITENDHPRYVKHVLGRIYIFFTLWVVGHAYATFHPGQLKNRGFQNLIFFDTMITYNDHPRYVKHVLGRIYVFFALLGYWAQGGGCLPRDWYTTCLCSFSPWAAQKSNLSKLIVLIQ